MTPEQAVHRERHPGQHRFSLVELVKRYRPRKMAEIGVMEGTTAAMVLEQCGDIVERYWGIDAWTDYGIHGGVGVEDSGRPDAPQDVWDGIYRKVVRLLSQFPQARVLRMWSREAARLFALESLDMVFIDGDHSYKGCRADIVLWSPIVKRNGVIVGHDYYQHWPGVVLAVNEMFPPHALRFADDTCWYVEKGDLA